MMLWCVWIPKKEYDTILELVIEIVRKNNIEFN